MKLLFKVLFALLLSSCSIQLNLAEMRGYTLPVATRQTEGDKREAIWARIMRMFAEHDIPIKMVDKSSGFIESDIMSFVKAYTIDQRKTNATAEKDAYVVVQLESLRNLVIHPSYITGQVKIFILTEPGKTEIQVSIENLKNFYYSPNYSYRTNVEVAWQVYSTGTLENLIEDYVTHKTDSINILLLKGTVLNTNENRAAVYEEAKEMTQ